MNPRHLAAILLVPFAVLACGEQAQQQATTEEQAEEPAAETDAGAQAEGQNQLSLQPKNDSGITGTARWQVEGDSVRVMLSLEGLTEGDQYPAHVHRGTCTEGGGVAAALSPVTGQSGGTGESIATVARDNFSSGESYYVQAHLPDGTPATCGNLPSGAGLAPGAGGGM